MTAEQPSQEPNTASTGKATSLLTKCHCGRIQIQIPKPTKLNECHCTVCYKYGALWAYYNHDEVTIKIADDTTLTEYVRDDSDGNLSFNRCGHCGCMMTWKGLGEYSGPEHHMGINCRMLPKEDIKDVERKISTGPL